MMADVMQEIEMYINLSSKCKRAPNTGAWDPFNPELNSNEKGKIRHCVLPPLNKIKALYGQVFKVKPSWAPQQM